MAGKNDSFFERVYQVVRHMVWLISVFLNIWKNKALTLIISLAQVWAVW